MEPLQKSQFISELWKKFKEKIEREWQEKYKRHGESIAQVGGKLNFAIAVQKDIENDLKNRGITIKKNKGTSSKQINEHTIHRFFQANSISNNAKDSTLECLSIYLGYQGWGHFQQTVYKKQKENRFESSVEPSSKDRKKLLLTLPLNYKKILLPTLLIIIILISFLYILNTTIHSNRLQKELELKKAENEYFENLVKQADTLQFKAYCSLPKIDTLGITEYYTKSGTALKDIIGFLESRQKTGRTLLGKESFFTVDTAYIISKSESKIKLKTTEYWKLIWCDPNDPLGWIYDVKNEQDYILIKEHGAWKIDFNYFEGSAKRPSVPPICN